MRLGEIAESRYNLRSGMVPQKKQQARLQSEALARKRRELAIASQRLFFLY
jgi:hypothetical protein